MVFPRGSGDFYHKYRPRTFDEVVGHSNIIKSLREVPTMDNPPQVFLFSGESGCGKTSCARILALSLNCLERVGYNPCCKCASCVSILEGANSDIQEINAADARGIDEIRRVKESMSLSPVLLNNKIYILDECHSLTKDAQQSLLKVLEEAPRSVFIILCSTEPSKILPTVRNRCQKYSFDRLPSRELSKLLNQVSEIEGLFYSSNVIDRVIEESGGSPRASLVYLQQLAQFGGELTAEAVDEILASQEQDDKEAIELCRVLIRGSKWKVISDMVKNIIVPPEVVRLTILGYFKACLLGAKSEAEADCFCDVMEGFLKPYYTVRPQNDLVFGVYKAWKILGRRKRTR